MKTDVTRVKNRIRLKLAVGKYESNTNARTEFLGKKYLRESYLSKAAACGDYTNAAYYIRRNSVAQRLLRSAVTLGYGRVVCNSLPAVILYKASKLVGKAGAQK